MPALHETRMGQQLFEGTLPRIAKALERIAASLEELVPLAKAEMEARRAARAPEDEG